MVLGRDADLLNEGLVDQGTAGPPTLAEQAKLEEMRRLKLRLDARNNANINAPGLRPANANPYTGGDINPATGQPWTGNERPETTPFLDTIKPTLKAISKDPVTAGVLAAPWLITGGALVAGGPEALGFGQGSGSLVGASEPAMAFKDTAVPAITRTPSAFPAGIGTPGTASQMAAGVTPAATGSAVGSTAGAVTGAAAGYGVREAIHDFSPLGVPIVGGLIKELLYGGKSKEQKALIAKQEQLAKEAEVRRGQQQTARMDTLAQQVMAFNPQNQMMAQLYGPQAALAPEQLAGMTKNPMAPDTSMGGYMGNDPKKKAQQAEQVQNLAAWQKANEDRYNQTLAGLSPLPQGPTPIRMPKPQPARRF